MVAFVPTMLPIMVGRKASRATTEVAMRNPNTISVFCLKSNNN